MTIFGNPNVLTESECKQIVYYLDVVDREDLWSPSTDPYWDRRTVEIMNIKDYPVLPILKKAYRKMRSAAPEGYEASSCRIVVWRAGTSADLHTDDIYLAREYSSILYLNDDFFGGFTDFPEQQTAVQPKTGMAIFFRGDSEHPHRVTEVAGGTRYTITGFWTNDPEHKTYEEWAAE
jgi:hypothetical protein